MTTSTPLNSTTTDELWALLRVCQTCCCGRSFVFNGVKNGRFPAPDVRIGTRFTRWRRSTVENWIAANGKTRQHEGGTA